MSTFKLNSGYDIPAVGLGTWVGYYYLHAKATTNRFVTAIQTT